MYVRTGLTQRLGETTDQSATIWRRMWEYLQGESCRQRQRKEGLYFPEQPGGTAQERGWFSVKKNVGEHGFWRLGSSRESSSCQHACYFAEAV